VAEEAAEKTGSRPRAVAGWFARAARLISADQELLPGDLLEQFGSRQGTDQTKTRSNLPDQILPNKFYPIKYVPIKFYEADQTRI